MPLSIRDTVAVAVRRAIDPIDQLLVLDPGRRGVARFFRPGGAVGAWNRPLGALFLVPSRATTVGVGDGGNEIGMGAIPRNALKAAGVPPRIASVVPVDHLVVAGVSNWGAYGIVAHLGRLAGRNLLHSGADERRLIEACVRAGAVDGITRRREATVDGVPLAAHAGIVELMNALGGRR